MNSNHQQDLVIGLHSIIEAIKNPKRLNKSLLISEEGMDLIRKNFPQWPKFKEAVTVVQLSPHEVQARATQWMKDQKFEPHRVPSQMALFCSPLVQYEGGQFFEDFPQHLDVERPFRAVCLDQVTDVNNAAAILRTASFYNLDVLIMGCKKPPLMPPSYFRIASGATEHVPIIWAPHLTKFIQQLTQHQVNTVVLDERGTPADQLNLGAECKRLCVIMGAEDIGVSNAVKRLCSQTMALVPQGHIRSLNVSVASAVVMEKLWAKISDENLTA